jgi:hypothetical protein
MMGVSRSAVTQAWKAGRLQAYDINGRPWRGPRRRKAVSRDSGAPRTAETPAPAMGKECVAEEKKGAVAQRPVLPRMPDAD